MQKQRGFTKTDFQQLLLRGRAFIALILVTIVFSVMVDNFLDAANIEIMAKHVAINAFLAIGMTFVILTGGIYLSVGAIVGLVGMVAGALYGPAALPPRWLDALDPGVRSRCAVQA